MDSRFFQFHTTMMPQISVQISHWFQEFIEFKSTMIMRHCTIDYWVILHFLDFHQNFFPTIPPPFITFARVGGVFWLGLKKETTLSLFIFGQISWKFAWRYVIKTQKKVVWVEFWIFGLELFIARKRAKIVIFVIFSPLTP